MRALIHHFKSAIQVGLLSIALFFTVNAHAWYGPFGSPPDNYAYKVCIYLTWKIGDYGVTDTNDPTGWIGKMIEMCTYYDSSGDTVGYSMAIIS